ncbi:MAG: pyrroloquinoline quinone-dependent dehydrogenase [Alphaproteobacteria bacterium]|nr:pyrroloquinoline quinone-dependent dehydrogenase [Alphaproteobacteria bacterium]
MIRGSFALFVLAALALAAQAQDWGHVGGDLGGQRASAAAQITPANIDRLARAWSYSTGDARLARARGLRWKFQATPILVEDRLIFCTPFNDVVALHPGTGRELWRYRSHSADIEPSGNGYSCRGVTQWRDPKAGPSSACRTRILMGTNDFRLIAIDAQTGNPCHDFGKSGVATLDPGKALLHRGEIQITSPPIVVRGVVIVGSAISDGLRQKAPSGAVRAFDARTGLPLWRFDPVPRDPADPARATWLDGSADHTGHANVWSLMSADEARGLVFLPTSSPSVDHYGGLRPGDNRYANSVVALHAETGRVAWHFQTVHHDLWDYDVAAQPLLATIDHDGRNRDVVIQATKMGLVFTLDRDTGEPVFEVEERAVPKGDVPGEWYSPTQPFPVAPRSLVPTTLSPDEAWGVTPWDRAICRDLIRRYRYDGIYTPPSLEGTIHYPFISGGVNWGGGAFDARTQTLYVNTNNAAGLIRLRRRADEDTSNRDIRRGGLPSQSGTPYAVERTLLASPFGAPCNPPPFGQLHAIDMRTGEVVWERPLGTLEDTVPFGDVFLPRGSGNMGGSIVTASGVLFIGAAMDNYLRAFDAKSGSELWRGRLPAGGQATPMTYVWHGRQYVAIAAGGHEIIGTTPGDTLVAFSLDEVSPLLLIQVSRLIERPTLWWFGFSTLVAVFVGAMLSGRYASRISCHKAERVPD